MSDITIDRNFDGSFTATALVSEYGCQFYHHMQYFGYPVREIKAIFREDITGKGYEIVEED